MAEDETKQRLAQLLKDANDASLHGRNDEARKAYEEALQLARSTGDRLGEANVLCGLGGLERILGRNDEARAAFDKALPLYRAVGDRLGEANTLKALGILECKFGREDKAKKYFEDAGIQYGLAGMKKQQEEVGKLMSAVSQTKRIPRIVIASGILVLGGIGSFLISKFDIGRTWNWAIILSGLGILAKIFSPEIRSFLGLSKS